MSKWSVGEKSHSEGYDSGFAGKYDKEKADRCAQENDEYNRSWGYACRDAGLVKATPLDVGN